MTTILFSTQASKSNKVEEKWTFSIISKNNPGYTCSTYSSMVAKVKPDIGSMSIGTQKNKILVDEPINLAVCVSNEKSPSTILAGVFYNNEALKQVITNDYVYILRCKFKKDIK